MLTLRESVRYRGRGGHYSWIAHRLAGLGILAFLVIHIWETAMANYNPPVYEYAIALFKHPLFGVGEIGLMGAVLFHAFNGIRITLLDFKPEWWRSQAKSVTIVWVLFLVVFIPIAIYMFSGIVAHCGHGANCWAFPTYPVS
jgi:succinate dehydrogenase / fumarate reductase cytochrome b subunit